jgi:hypothetical protein
MYASTWLERLFQSCQRKSTNGSSKEEQLIENQHHLLSYEQLPNFGNDALVCFIEKFFFYKKNFGNFRSGFGLYGNVHNFV